MSFDQFRRKCHHGVWSGSIERYGKPTQIHIELARDLKLNAKQREKVNEQNRKNREDRKRRRDKFFQDFKRNPTDGEMEKLLLW